MGSKGDATAWGREGVSRARREGLGLLLSSPSLLFLTPQGRAGESVLGSLSGCLLS